MVNTTGLLLLPEDIKGIKTLPDAGGKSGIFPKTICCEILSTSKLAYTFSAGK